MASLCESVDKGFGALPLGELGSEGGSAVVGEAVIGAGLAGGGGVRVGGGESGGLQAFERRVEGGLLDRVLTGGDLGDGLGDLVGVGGAVAQERQHDEVDIAADGVGTDHSKFLPVGGRARVMVATYYDTRSTSSVLLWGRRSQ